MNLPHFSKYLGALSIVALATVILPSSCRPGSNHGETDTYIENGQLWAYGRVALTWLEGPGAIMLERVTTDQSVDTPATDSAGRSQRFQLYGALLASTTETSGRRDLAYVDYHSSEEKLLAYAWSVEVSPRAGSADRHDIYATLRKAGRSRPGYKKVFLGSAVLSKAGQVPALAARVDLEPGVKLSLIGEGVYQGQWALHFPEARMVTPPNFSGFCGQKVSQMPGQMPSQNPGQKTTCRPLPPQIDLCKGTPTQAGCRPQSPVQSKIPSQAPGEVTGLTPVGPETDRVYEVQESAPAGGKIVFESTVLSADENTNAELCSQRFFAVARTEGDQINTSCVLKAAPSTVRNGHLTCAVTVEFDNPQTYLEKICNVSGLFSGSSELVQTVQILRK
jgi:hypothetical protein